MLCATFIPLGLQSKTVALHNNAAGFCHLLDNLRNTKLRFTRPGLAR